MTDIKYETHAIPTNDLINATVSTAMLKIKICIQSVKGNEK